jgi:hypothetical protein
MSNDAAGNGTGAAQPEELSVAEAGLVGALARLAHAQSKGILGPLMDTPGTRLVEAFEKDGQPGVVVKVGDEVVGKYTVNVVKPKIVVDQENESALDAYAEEHGGIEVVIRRNPTWEAALLKFAKRDKESGQIVDTRTGEVIPGLKYETGGQPTGTVTFTWDKTTGGDATLLEAWQRGDFDHLLRDTPQLLPARKPTAEDA